ncbi:hypothetical protein NPIL_560411 [Nephila pilipes]|uniref:Uncharacterized protein n=1 Tax=Nephila pilipes TaxID=299642 RepID=A0A8X6NYT3_NEPPI|nr:hypothetical protein NPIL_560411 [Nephila pilipes]
MYPGAYVHGVCSKGCLESRVLAPQLAKMAIETGGLRNVSKRYVDDERYPVTLPFLHWMPNVLNQKANARLHKARISQHVLQRSTGHLSPQIYPPDLFNKNYLICL